ncbi:MAG: DNA polymerase III subunit delta' [Agathobacter sp.]|nr:DNA polymerase III subunit delta' [Agathobacter sp.]
MAGYRDIVGHKQIIEHLKRAVSMNKISHAYIFNGEKDSGKRMIAEAFAQTLQCEAGGSEPCMNCRSCRQAKEYNHPDIIYVTHEKPNLISVDEIRHQLNNDIVIKPYSGKYKIYIVEEAEKMNEAAQNALLKTLEEPPSFAVILLLTSNADGFLPTILSRCVTFHLRTVGEDLIKDLLMRKYQVPDYQAEVCAAFAQGNVGKAIHLASDPDFNQKKSEIISLAKKIEDMDLYEFGRGVQMISQYKDSMGDFFDLLTLWYRDVLYYKSTESASNLIFKDEVYDIKKQAAKKSFSNIEAILKGIELAKSRLGSNVNFELTIELLLFTMKEN